MADIEFGWKSGKDAETAVDQLRELDEALERNLESSGDDIGLRIIADARRLVNVDTGWLRASLSHEVQSRGDIISILAGSNVPYAPHQEVIKPYLRPGVEKNRDVIIRHLKQALMDAADEASR